MKILHTADLHIGAELSYLEANREARRYEVMAVFDNITKLCIDEKVDFCLIAGDLFDSNASAKQFFSPVCEAVAKAKDTKFLYVAGNHDPLDASSPFSTEKLPENLTVFGADYETVLFEEQAVRVTGRSFSHSQMDFKPFETMPDDGKINIMLMHCDFGAAGSIYNPITAEVVSASGADYFALGHIHKRTAVEKVANTFVSYPGCPEGQGFDESGSKGVYLGEISKGDVNLKFVPCSLRLHVIKKLDLSDSESTEQAYNTIISSLEEEFGEGFENNLYKLLLTGYSDNPKAIDFSLLDMLLLRELYFVKLKNKLRKKINLELLAKEPSLKGVFVRKCLNG